jgi:mevalonate pyrophosphate decarboxylase
LAARFARHPSRFIASTSRFASNSACRIAFGGPGAFVMVAENSNSFGNVIVKKLIAEIAQAVPQQRRKIDEAAN